MEFALASAIGLLTAAGVYLLLRARSFDLILGLTLLSYATNLLIFASGRVSPGKPPVLRDGVQRRESVLADRHDLQLRPSRSQLLLQRASLRRFVLGDQGGDGGHATDPSGTRISAQTPRPSAAGDRTKAARAP